MKAEIITIGDEILLGQIVDTNSAWIAQQLNVLQIHIAQMTSITDSEVHILETLKTASKRADIIICTGGLGPTKDDVTKATIAKYFNSEIIHNEQVMEHVKQIFARFNRTMPDMNYGQADVLEKAEVLFNDWGTAPGMWVSHEGKIYIFLPGVPTEMKNLMTFRALPKLKEFKGKEKLALRYILTVGIGESHLAEQIADIENAFPEHVKLAYLPKIGMVRLRINVSGNEEKLINEEADKYQKVLIERIGDAVVASEDLSFEEVIIKRFSEDNNTLSTAESCTGGNIAKQITEISGASKMFIGSVVSYSNTVKEHILHVSTDTLKHHGAVSEETVIEMARGVKAQLGTDYSISTSGIAGPDGGTKTKPVGTIWIAVAGKSSIETKKFHFHGDRLNNIERTTSQALLMLWNLYRKENPC